MVRQTATEWPPIPVAPPVAKCSCYSRVAVAGLAPLPVVAAPGALDAGAGAVHAVHRVPAEDGVGAPDGHGKWGAGGHDSSAYALASHELVSTVAGCAVCLPLLVVALGAALGAATALACLEPKVLGAAGAHSGFIPLARLAAEAAAGQADVFGVLEPASGALPALVLEALDAAILALPACGRGTCSSQQTPISAGQRSMGISGGGDGGGRWRDRGAQVCRKLLRLPLLQMQAVVAASEGHARPMQGPHGGRAGEGAHLQPSGTGLLPQGQGAS